MLQNPMQMMCSPHNDCNSPHIGHAALMTTVTAHIETVASHFEAMAAKTEPTKTHIEDSTDHIKPMKPT